MTTSAEREGQPEDRHPPVSEEDLRDYARQLRTVPAEHVVSDLLFTALSAAQVKLGRRDARLLIDLCTVMHEHVRDYVSAELTHKIDTFLGQLRLGQVSAENQAAGKGEAEPNDLDRTPTPPTVRERAGRQQASANTPASGTSKLWVPGQ